MAFIVVAFIVIAIVVMAIILVALLSPLSGTSPIDLLG